jgi:alkylation response protein AidB-like acyl-CoA dehydrogenase
MTTTAANLDLTSSEVERDLRSTLRDLLASRCPVQAVSAMYDGDRSIVEPLWKTLATELGLSGLIVSESLGGVGGTPREAAVVLEELGYACAPTTFLTSSVMASSVLVAASTAADGQADAGGVEARPALHAVAAGEQTAALVVPFATAPDAQLPGVTLTEGRVDGTVRGVAGVVEADILVVPARGHDDDAVAVLLVERADAQITPVVSLDMGRQVCDVTFVGSRGRLLLADGEAVVRSSLVTSAALLASEQVGIARWCLDETVAYLKVRRQFGRVVGGFQAIKHRLADLYAEVSAADATARYAAAALAAREDVAVAARVAAAYCSDIAVHAAEEAVQLHGGIGMTWEHPLHLYLKKAKADQIALGTWGAHRAALAQIVDLGRA